MVGSGLSVFERLLNAKEEMIHRLKREVDAENDFEKFRKSMQCLKRDLEIMGYKPSRDKLFGRPFRDE